MSFSNMASKHFSFEPEGHFFFLTPEANGIQFSKGLVWFKKCQTHTIWQNMFSCLNGLTHAVGARYYRAFCIIRQRFTYNGQSVKDIVVYLTIPSDKITFNTFMWMGIGTAAGICRGIKHFYLKSSHWSLQHVF